MKSSEITKGIVRFLREQCGSKSAVVGISGGLDSAVVAALSTRALGPNRVYGILMFDRDVNNTQDYYDALAVCKKFRLQKIEVNMMLLKNALLGTLTPNMAKHRLLKGNAVARLRMMMLYAYAFWYEGLVVGTSDKSEKFMGFFTKHGDGACDVAPIADLYKTEVRTLAKYLGVPSEVIAKPSSPNFWEGQKAEDELGHSYEIIDSMLKGNMPFSIRILQQYMSTEHKRQPPAFWRNNVV